MPLNCTWCFSEPCWKESRYDWGRKLSSGRARNWAGAMSFRTWQGILVGKETVVGVHGKLRTGRHSLGEQVGSHGSRSIGGDRPGKEEPDVGPVAGPGALHSRAQPLSTRHLHVRRHVLPPPSLVDDLGEGLLRAFPASHLRLPTDTVDPLIGAGRGVALLSRLPIPPEPWEHVFPTGKEGSKERDLFLPGPRGIVRERHSLHHRR